MTTFKRTIFILIFSVMSSAFLVHAADLPAIQESAKALVGAVSGVLDETRVTSQHLPGYGLHIAVKDDLSTLEQAKVQEQLKTVVLSLSGLIRGLDAGDWVSVGFSTEKYSLLVRVKPNQNATLEIWLDGKKLP
jgi:hypothetical protein